MFNVVKSLVPSKPFNYTDPDIVALVKSDFHDKCYLCEEKTPRHLEVEHFYPQAFYEHLVHDWQNLLCICEKCNKVRPKVINTTSENEVLDCCVDDVETAVSLRFNESDASFLIDSNDGSAKTNNTVDLLEKIHNGRNTSSLSFIDLRKLVATELAELEEEIGFFTNTVLKRAFQKKIERRLSKASAFTAVKRSFIKDRHPGLTRMFD